MRCTLAIDHGPSDNNWLPHGDSGALYTVTGRVASADPITYHITHSDPIAAHNNVVSAADLNLLRLDSRVSAHPAADDIKRLFPDVTVTSNTRLLGFRSYTFALDSAMDSQWDSLLRVDQKELNGAKRADISLPRAWVARAVPQSTPLLLSLTSAR